ncbi:MAG: hypothetical protein RLY85_17, partial [Bacteroidota bacterium]
MDIGAVPLFMRSKENNYDLSFDDPHCGIDIIISTKLCGQGSGKIFTIGCSLCTRILEAKRNFTTVSCTRTPLRKYWQSCSSIV